MCLFRKKKTPLVGALKCTDEFVDFGLRRSLFYINVREVQR